MSRDSQNSSSRERVVNAFVNRREFVQLANERDDLSIEVVWHGAMRQPDTATRGELLPRYRRMNREGDE